MGPAALGRILGKLHSHSAYLIGLTLTENSQVHCQCYTYAQWLKYKIGGGGSLSISEYLRDPADISRCIVDVNWAPDISIAKYLGPGSQIRQDSAHCNHCT